MEITLQVEARKNGRGEREPANLSIGSGLAAGAVRRYELEDQRWCVICMSVPRQGLASVAALFAQDGAIDWGMYWST